MAEQISINASPTWKNISFWRLSIGVVMALLGMYVCFNPISGLVALALYIGIAFIIAGIAYVVTSFSLQSGWELLVGLIDIFIGFILVSNLGVTAATLPAILAIWSLAVGVIQIIGAVHLRKIDMPWTWSLMTGICGLLFAFLIFIYPMVGVMTITALLGIYLMIYGLFSLMEAFYLPKSQM